MLTLYSFLGLITLQIGVAVLSALFFTIAFKLIVSTFITVQTEEGTIPINYILVAVFVVLLIISGTVMFLAAYKEKTGLCFIALILCIVVFLFFLITSIVSFINMPSLYRQVCVHENHCPETVWFSSLCYREEYDDFSPETNDTESDVEGANATSSDQSNGSADELQVKRYKNDFLPRSLHRYEDTLLHNGFGKHSLQENKREHMNERIKPLTDEPEKTVGLEIHFPFDLSAAYSLFENNKRVPNIFKRSPSLKQNYFKQEPFSKVKKMYKRDNTSGTVDKNSVTVYDNGTTVFGNGTIANPRVSENGTTVFVNGTVEYPDGTRVYPDGRIVYADGTIKFPNGTIVDGDEGKNGTTKEKPENAKYVFGLDFILTLLLFLIFAIFFLFTILIVLNYKKQLTYMELYSVNPASKHYLLT